MTLRHLHLADRDIVGGIARLTTGEMTIARQRRLAIAAVEFGARLLQPDVRVFRMFPSRATSIPLTSV